MGILYQALGSAFGLALAVDDFTLARQRLYIARRKIADPQLACLAFRQGLNGELWIVKKGAKE